MRAVFWLTVTVAIIATTTALVQHRRHRSHTHDVDPATAPYIAPTAQQCRGPCPALNILANHGLLPRDGRNIDLAQLKNALLNIYGLGPSFGKFFAEAAFKKFVDPATGKLSLCDLLINIHLSDGPSKSSGIEHYGSLSRADRPAGPAGWGHQFDAAQRAPAASQLAMLLGSSSDGKMITLADMVRARTTIWNNTYRKLPSVKSDSLNTQEHIIASTEACLVLGVLSGNSNNGGFQISNAYAQTMLGQERFPAGWKKSSNPMGWPQVIDCLARMGTDWAANRITAILRVAKNWILRK